MDRHLHLRKFLLVVLALALAGGAQARTLQMEARQVSTGVARLENLSLKLDWKDTAPTGTLMLDAGLIDAAGLGYTFADAHWRCELLRYSATHYECAGAITARIGKTSKAKGFSLKASWRDGELDIALLQGKARLAYEKPAKASRIVGTKVPAPWLQPLLENAWSGGRFTDGAVTAQLALSTGKSGVALAGPLELSGIGLDSNDGSIAAAGVNAKGKLALDFGEKQTRVTAGFDFSGGELLYGSFYTALPATAARMDLALLGSGAKWQVESFSWRDPAVLELSARMAFDAKAASVLQSASVQASVADAAIAIPRYADSLLGMGGLSGLAAKGTLKAELELNAQGMQRLRLRPNALDLTDPAGRFDVAGLAGDVTVFAGDVAVPGEVRWQKAHVHGIEIGAAIHAIQSRKRGLELAKPATLGILDGQMRLSRLSYAPDAKGDAAYDLAMVLNGVDLAKLSTTFGWPAFDGTLSGSVSGLRYLDDVLELQGSLNMALFDGRVSIEALRMERPFGVAPTLSASVELSNLDLKPLTGAFGFGEISGRLEGYIRDLRLVNWSPAAFDAYLQTSTRAKDPRKISQRAVRELTQVGGGGIAAGLQNTVLKAFSQFGYEQIGLGCMLANNVCTMRGLPSKGQGGYTIVDGSGLPRVNVIGHQSKVDWPVLMSRLKAAVSGEQSPVFD